MGLFSSIWKGVKNVFSGIMKVFAPILKPIGKILNTGWGKAIMLAMSVFTLGGSLLAGGQTFMQTAGSFMDKFIAGGKEFITQALGLKPKAEKMVGTGVEAGVQAGTETAASQLAAQQAGQAGELLTSGMPGGEAVGVAGAPPSGSMAMGPPPTGDTMMQAVQAGGEGAAGQGAMLPSAEEVAATYRPPTPTSGLGAGEAAKPGKAANAAWDWAKTEVPRFAKSELGQELIGGAMEGYYQGKRDEAYYAEQRRIDDMWRNPNDPGRIGIESSRERMARFTPPRGLAGAPATYASGSSATGKCSSTSWRTSTGRTTARSRGTGSGRTTARSSTRSSTRWTATTGYSAGAARSASCRNNARWTPRKTYRWCATG
jgi:hypothetical protein